MSPGYAEHMGLAQFRRRFQVLDPLLLKKLDSTSEGLDERKVCELGSQAGEARCSHVTTVLYGLLGQGSKSGV